MRYIRLVVMCQIPFVVSLSNLAIGESVARVASGDLWRHEQPFDILPQKDRVNGISLISYQNKIAWSIRSNLPAIFRQISYSRNLFLYDPRTRK